jgi:hypothetical protein
MSGPRSSAKTTPGNALGTIAKVAGGMVLGFVASGMIGKHAPPHNQHVRNAGLAVLAILGAVNSKKGSDMQLVAVGLGAGAVANSVGSELEKAGLMNGANRHSRAVRELPEHERALLMDKIKAAKRMAYADPQTLNGAVDVVTMNGYDYI